MLTGYPVGVLQAETQNKGFQVERVYLLCTVLFPKISLPVANFLFLLWLGDECQGDRGCRLVLSQHGQ